MSYEGEIKVTEFTVRWKIENFCICTARWADKLTSPIYHFDGVKGLIQMRKTEHPESKTAYISLFLCLEELSKIAVYFRFSILTQENQEVYSTRMSRETVFTSQETTWGFLYYLQSTDPILANDQLIIQCSIAMGQSGIEDKGNLAAKTSLTESFNFEKFLFSELLSDVQLIVGEEVFCAHKFILAAKSDVFAAMFTHKMKESTENKVKIEGFDCEVIREMLRYIYTQKVGDIETITEDLLAVAHEYLLNELKSICESNLVESLSNDNFFSRMLIADKYNLHYLKKETVQYIAFNLDAIIDQMEEIQRMEILITSLAGRRRIRSL